jgi:tripeptidyl-peptidase I
MVASRRILLATFLTAVCAKPLAQNLVLHEQRDAIPSGFSRKAAADGSTVLNLRLALAESNTDGLIEALYDVSTPSSANYGQHLAKEDVSVPC